MDLLHFLKIKTGFPLFKELIRILKDKEFTPHRKTLDLLGEIKTLLEKEIVLYSPEYNRLRKDKYFIGELFYEYEEIFQYIIFGYYSSDINLLLEQLTFFFEIILFLNELVFYETENDFYFDFDILRNDQYMYYKDRGDFSRTPLFTRKQEKMYQKLGLEPWPAIWVALRWFKEDWDKYIAKREQNLEEEYDYYLAKRDYFDVVLSKISLKIKDNKLTLVEYRKLKLSFHDKLLKINSKSPIFIINEENVILGLGLRKRYYRETAYNFLGKIEPEYRSKSREFFINSLDERRKLQLKDSLIGALSQKNWKEREWAAMDYGYIDKELKYKPYPHVIAGLEEDFKNKIADKLGRYFYTRSNIEKLKYDQINSAVDALIAMNTEKSISILRSRLHYIDFKDIRKRITFFLDNAEKQKAKQKIEVQDIKLSYPIDLQLGIEGIIKKYNLSRQFGHNKVITSLVINPDAKFVITGSDDKTIRIWDLNSGKALSIIPSEFDGKIILTVSQDGNYIISNAVENKIDIIDLKTGKVIRQFSGHKTSIEALKFTNDGNRLISVSHDKEIKIWDFHTGNLLQKFQSDYSISNFILTSDDKFLISPISTSKINIWDIENFNLKSSFELKNFWGGTLPIALSTDSEIILTVNLDKRIDFLDFQTGKPIKRIKAHKDHVSGMRVSPNGKYLATFGEDDRYDYRVKIWDFHTGELIKDFKNKRYTLKDILFTPDSKNLIFQYGTLFNLWNLEKGDFVYDKIPPVEDEYGYNCLTTTVSPDGKYGISAYRNSTIKIWEIETGKVVRAFVIHISIEQITVSNNFKYLVCSCEDFTVKAWDYKTGEYIKTFSGHKGRIRKIWISNDNRYVASCSYDGTINIWEFETSKLLRTFGTLSRVLNAEKEWERWRESMDAFAITPDMKYVIGGLYDGIIKVWVYESKKILHIIRTSSDRIGNIFLTADNKKIIVSLSRIIKIYDIATGKQLRLLGLFEIKCHFVSSEGRSIVCGTTHPENILWVFDIDRNQIIAKIQQINKITTIIHIPTTYYILLIYEKDEAFLLDIQQYLNNPYKKPYQIKERQVIAEILYNSNRKSLSLFGTDISDLNQIEGLSDLDIEELYIKGTNIPQGLIDELGGLNDRGAARFPKEFIKNYNKYRNRFKNDLVDLDDSSKMGKTYPSLTQEELELTKEKDLHKQLEVVDKLLEKKQYDEVRDKLETIIHEAKRYHLNILENKAKEKFNKYKNFWQN